MLILLHVVQLFYYCVRELWSKFDILILKNKSLTYSQNSKFKQLWLQWLMKRRNKR